MPILDIGYRHWDGDRSPAWTRLFVVAATSVALVWQGSWTKRLLVLLVFPSLATGIFVGAFEQTIVDQSTQQAIRIIERDRDARELMKSSGLDISVIREDPEQARHLVWSYLLFTLFRYPQAFGMILLLGIVAPRLISYDLRSRGYLLYLSRPLTPLEYVFGKAGVLYVLIFLVATLPALAIYVFGLFLSTNSSALLQTWDIPLRILLASVVLILPTSAVALALSSLTKESRYASFAWFAMWLIGQLTFFSLWMAQAINSGGQEIRRRPVFSDLMYLSPYELLGYLQRKVFGLVPDSSPTMMPLLYVVVITLVGYGIAYWRVSRTLKT